MTLELHSFSHFWGSLNIRSDCVTVLVSNFNYWSYLHLCFLWSDAEKIHTNTHTHIYTHTSYIYIFYLCSLYLYNLLKYPELVSSGWWHEQFSTPSPLKGEAEDLMCSLVAEMIQTYLWNGLIELLNYNPSDFHEIVFDIIYGQHVFCYNHLMYLHS